MNIIGKKKTIHEKSPFIDKYSCKGMNYSSGKDYWRKFEKNNPTIALDVLYTKKE